MNEVADVKDKTTAPVVASLRGVSKFYGEDETQVVALDNVSLDFAEGSFSAIMGPSGSGKSTLLYCLAALEWPSSGQIIIGGADISRLNDASLTRLRQTSLGFVFQSYNLVPTLTAAENIYLPLQIAKRDIRSKEVREYFRQLVETLDIKDRLRHLPGELSGGQQQRVAVARALISRPQIIVADEPSGNLDTKSSKVLLEFFRLAVEKYNQTIVMVTHDIQAASYADQVVFLKDGAVADYLKSPTVTGILGKLESLED
ncbi:ABC transporter ATP-binding protein [Candidatus Saccharibacteria bacterium]|nr:ABC transporter ATP-binding protein [Candidatus Saccharibacteria bacterium]